jgi:hypothetical protein
VKPSDRRNPPQGLLDRFHETGARSRVQFNARTEEHDMADHSLYRRLTLTLLRRAEALRYLSIFARSADSD